MAPKAKGKAKAKTKAKPVVKPPEAEKGKSMVDMAKVKAKARPVGPVGDKNWEEEPSRDPRQDNWRQLPEAWCKACEAAFNDYKSSGDTAKRRASVDKDCTVDFELMTCMKKGSAGKSFVVPIRRLGKDDGQPTHPDPSKSHPWFVKKSAMADKSGDWLTNDFFWKAFCACLAKAGKKVKFSPEDLFDFQYNKDYRDWTGADKEKRGGLMYGIPKGWKRFACRVKNKYGDDNKWLRLDGGDGEWAVAYHGTTSEALVPIIDGGLKAGGAQAYKNSKDARTGKKIGVGIYCTPGMGVAEEYAMSRGGGGTKVDGKRVHFVLQCRVMPDAIMRCHDEDKNPGAYWVVNSDTHIRPYGVLVKEAKPEEDGSDSS
jgi:hypothetical protein